MIGTILSKFFGTKNERDIKRMWPLVEQVNSIDSHIISLSDGQLKDKTEQFKRDIETGKTLDEILRRHLPWCAKYPDEGSR